MSIYDNVASGGAPAPAADDMVVPDYAPSSSKPMESMGGGGGDMSASASSGGGKMGGGVAVRIGFSQYSSSMSSISCALPSANTGNSTRQFRLKVCVITAISFFSRDLAGAIASY
jgi:hypothetical protein